MSRELEPNAHEIANAGINRYGTGLIRAIPPELHDLFREVAANIVHDAIELGEAYAAFPQDVSLPTPLECWTRGYIAALDDIDNGQRS